MQTVQTSKVSGILWGFCTNYGLLWRFCTLCGELWRVVSKLYTAVNILMFAMHLCIYRSLYSIVLSTVESTWGLLMYKCEHLISKSHLVRISISNIGMVNDLLFDILGHIGDTVSHHVTFLCTSPTYSLMFLQIPPIELLQFSPMTLLDPPPQLFVYNADSARLSSGC